jgi:hypothetical protein
MSNRNGRGGSWLGLLMTGIVVVVLAIIALKVVFAVVGVVFGIGAFLLFTLGPVLFVGWLVIKALRYFSRDTSAATM